MSSGLTPTATNPRRRRAWPSIVAVVAVLASIAVAVALVVLRRPEPPTPAAPVPAWPTRVTTLAGAGAPGFAEGRGTEAAFADPFGVAVDATGTTYLSDGGDNNRIWRITPNGTAAVLAGGHEGFADGDGGASAFNTPSGLALDGGGNLIVADTGNHAIRRVTPAGHVETIAGTGQAGYRDGPAAEAQFDGPIGVAIAGDGAILVADSYNDRLRRIDRAGNVTTLAGGGAPGFIDGAALDARFDTPSAVAVDRAGRVYIADTGNDAVRRLDLNGEVTTVGRSSAGVVTLTELLGLFRPVGLAMGHGGELYITDGSGRVTVLPPGAPAITLAGGDAGFANGDGTSARFRNPSGIAVAPDGTLRVADTDNLLVRRLTRPSDPVPGADFDLTPVPLLTAATLGVDTLVWPFDPQGEPHELAATVGEARGSLAGDGRGRLHTGIDVQSPIGSLVLAVRDEKVARPIPNGVFGNPNESLHVGAVSYVHMRVGRTRSARPLDPARFTFVFDDRGRPVRVRVRRGTRFHVGDALGTLNALSHVHLEIGPRGAEINPLSLPLVGFADHVAPTIAANGVKFYGESGEELRPALPPSPRRGAAGQPRPLLSGRVSIVVDAYDRVDGNRADRRLGVYAMGYQVLQSDGTPAPGFDEPRMTIVFDRLPADAEAPQLVYAEGSGITAYGNRITRFRYIVTDSLIDGIAARGAWDTSSLPAGDYTIRVVAADRSGNTTTRDVAVRVEK